MVGRLAAAGHWHEGDPDIIVVLDSGYDLTRLAWLLDGLPWTSRAGCARPGHVLPGPARGPGRTAGRSGTGPGSASASRRPGRAGGRHRHADVPVRHAKAVAWPRLHQQLAAAPPGSTTTASCRHRGHSHPPPGRSPAGCRDAEPVWLWSSRAAHRRRGEPGLAGVLAPFRYRAYVPVPEAAAGIDRRSSADRPRRPLDLDHHHHLRPAAPRRDLAADIRLPGSSLQPATSPPPRVRIGVPPHPPGPAVPAARRNLPPGSRRPAGSKNQRPATRHDIGKTVKREEPRETRSQAGSMASLACYLTHVVWVVLSCLCCPACRADMRRPPL